ncbi:hypothetical protein F4806DRAFT_406417 [Annulohypoxylon nitens]|nr:hypothetical protein F4806DRAFT_406417 [Annulohypoxylon nitens]
MSILHLRGAHTSANLLSLAATSLLIPTASLLLSQTTEIYVVKQSRGESFLLIAVYASYLVYQFKTHPSVFKEDCEKVPPNIKPLPSETGIARGLAEVGRAMSISMFQEDGTIHNIMDERALGADDDDDEVPLLSFPVALATFAGFSALLAICVDFAVGSINALSTERSISSTFIGLILLPIPNCEFTTITYALDDKMNLVMTFTIVKCLQTALFVIPLSVLLGWGLGVNEVTLVFSGFEVVSLFAAVVLLNFLLTEGKVTWYGPIPY